jgi:hypothetical protein
VLSGSPINSAARRAKRSRGAASASRRQLDLHGDRRGLGGTARDPRADRGQAADSCRARRPRSADASRVRPRVTAAPPAPRSLATLADHGEACAYGPMPGRRHARPAPRPPAASPPRTAPPGSRHVQRRLPVHEARASAGRGRRAPGACCSPPSCRRRFCRDVLSADRPDDGHALNDRPIPVTTSPSGRGHRRAAVPRRGGDDEHEGGTRGHRRTACDAT